MRRAFLIAGVMLALGIGLLMLAFRALRCKKRGLAGYIRF